MILVATGDIGGARAVQSVLEVLRERRLPFWLLNNRLDLWTTHNQYPVVSLKNEDELRIFISQNQVKLFIFSTSVADTLPLSFGRILRAENQVPVFCVLDNWMNYRFRMEIDNKEMFVPDLYFMMDEYALKTAVGQGLPEKNLFVSGQPALGKLKQEYSKPAQPIREALNSKLGLDPLKKVLAFVNEPAANDQGESIDSKAFRGYTEFTVLKDLLSLLDKHQHKLEFILLPHPRDNKEKLKAFLKDLKLTIKVHLLDCFNSKDVIIASQYVAGMASILLYEAWLIGKPTLSYQPNLLKPDLSMMEDKLGQLFVTTQEDLKSAVTYWLSLEEMAQQQQGKLHENAASVIADQIEKVLYQDDVV